MKNNIKTTYVDDILDGPCIEYYWASSNRKAEYSYKQGKLDGAYTEFFESQRKKVEGSYKDDKKHGIWKYYNQEGKVIKTELWKDGKNETEKYTIMRKVSAKHADDKEPKTKIGKAIKKGVKTIEIANELAKLRRQKGK